MIIRKDQFSQYLQQDEQSFISLTVQHLRAKQTILTEDISDETLREMVSNGLTRARRYGLNTDEDLMAFVAVMFRIAPNFDEHPRLQQVLTNANIPVNKRFNNLFDPSLNKAWQEAQNKYDKRAWFPELSAQID